MKITSLTLAAIIGTGAALSASAITYGPTIGADSGPQYLINWNGTTASVSQIGSQGPYDGIEDTYIAVVNNSSSALNSLVLSSSQNIFGFDGDGIDTYGAVENGSNPDTTGYGGPISYFSNINGSQTAGTVNFYGGIAAGGSTYFSLEEALTGATGGLTIGPVNGGGSSAPDGGSTVLLLGSVVSGLGLLRRRLVS